MDDPLERAGELRAQHQQTTYEFLKTELQTCCIAIDFGKIQLELGNRGFAEHEAGEAKKGYHTIGQFLPQLEYGGRRMEIQTKMRELLETLNAFRITLGLVALD